MVEIVEIELDVQLPIDNVGVVAMQPFVELSDTEPFRWGSESSIRQIDRVVRTLEIASEASHGCNKTHFTILPEYAIPGLEGVARIQGHVSSASWAEGTIVIGGVHGLNTDEYATLCEDDMTQVSGNNSSDAVRAAEWVNCCVVWVKEQDGVLRRWIQPKMAASWPERNVTSQNMFSGKSVFLFKCEFENGIEFRFLVLICFDWIGRVGSNEGIWQILCAINRRWQDSGRRDINLSIIVQHNDEPNHHSFLENARDYFVKRTELPFVNRDAGVLLFANTAGGHFPGKYQTHGYTSLVFSPSAPFDTNACPPSYATITKKLRATESLGRCQDVLFRERGASIHSFRFRFPQFVNLDQADRCLPIPEAIVHPIEADSDDLRTPNMPVPASVKWINDQLDDIVSILERHSDNPLEGLLSEAHQEVSAKLRGCGDGVLRKYVEVAVCNYDKWLSIGERKLHKVDDWNENEKQALETVLHCLGIIGACRDLEICSSGIHAVIRKGTDVFDIAVVSGGETHEQCFEHAEPHLVDQQRFYVVITSDIHDFPYEKRSSSIFEPGETVTDKGPKITDPRSRFIHCGYQGIKNSCFQSGDADELDRGLQEIISI